MKKLLKSYDLKWSYEYFDMILESKTNGNHSQAVDQFKEMKRENRKEFIIYLFHHNINEHIVEFINLL